MSDQDDPDVVFVDAYNLSFDNNEFYDLINNGM